MAKFVHGSREFETLEDKRLYGVWASMKQRCLNPNNPAYRFYGDRGVTVSEEWLDFDNFYADMSSDYRLGLTLDRIDGAAGYSGENCRWVNWSFQQNNRSNNVKLTYDGVTLSLADWAGKRGIKRSTLAQRIYVYKWPLEKALTTKVTRRS